MDLQLNKLLYASPFPWWEWDIRSNRVVFNDMKATMLGYKAEDFRGLGYQKFTDLLHKEDYERTMNAMRLVLEGKTDLYQVDYRILAANGSYKWYMDRGTIIERQSGMPSKMRGIVIDLGSEKSPGMAAASLLHLLSVKNSVNQQGQEEHIYTLCSNCLKLKASDHRWIPVSDDIISELIGFPSHSICPDCIRLLYPQFADSILKKLTY